MTNFTATHLAPAYRCSRMKEKNMLSNESWGDNFWCPADKKREAARPPVALTMTPSEWAALSRLAIGEWILEAHIDRLEELGLVERAFGQALLTRLGRTTLGYAE